MNERSQLGKVKINTRIGDDALKYGKFLIKTGTEGFNTSSPMSRPIQRVVREYFCLLFGASNFRFE